MSILNFCLHISKANRDCLYQPPYERALVVAALQMEDVRWTETWADDPSWKTFVHVVDDAEAVNKVPKNKGREAMVYLTYMIDHYHDLANTSIFTHATQRSWHNDDFMYGDSVEMLSRLNSAKVQRDGYMNLRCRHEPGCPAHIHPFAVKSDPIMKPEEPYMLDAWESMFPDVAVPDVLAQPCCSQIAVSSKSIRSRPLAQYVHLRQWILDTEIPDGILGRIWEYVWQYLFTGNAIYCPDEIVCFCEGYGACFVDTAEKEKWYEMYQGYLALKVQAGSLMGTKKEMVERKRKMGDAVVEMKGELDRMREVVFARTK